MDGGDLGDGGRILTRRGGGGFAKYRFSAADAGEVAQMPPVKGSRCDLAVLSSGILGGVRRGEGLLRHFYRRITIVLAETIELWWLPVLAGTTVAAVLWVVWFLTEVPCTPANAAVYQCNPEPIARYIDSEILARCITVGGLVATLTGGLNIYMFAREREARVAAEKQRDEERRLFAEQRDEDRRQFEERREEDRRQFEVRLAEERRRSDENQQALLAAIAGLTDKIAELSGPNRGNGQ